MTTNSATSIVGLQHVIYSSSSDSGDWIQEPISLLPYDETLELNTIDGIYVQVKQADILAPLNDVNLAQEFSAWEAASNEDFKNFEQELK